MEIINSYDGPGFVDGGNPGTRRKSSEQSIKESHRKVMGAMARNGVMALNAADYERTMNLPVGRGRLACDETGAFDAEAYRSPYNPQIAPKFPFHLHSTITEGEFISVRSEEEITEKLATRKWAIKPLEKLRRFTLTEADQIQKLTLEIQGERAARMMIERNLEMGITGMRNLETPTPQDTDILTLQAAKIAELEKQNREINERFEALMTRFEADEDAPKGKRK
jgi:hypothetical protein